jgi:hypothetical protein
MATQEATKPISSIEEIPLMGSYPAFNRDRLGFLLALARTCGDVGRFHFGPFPALFFNTSELVHSVLVEHVNDFDSGAVRHNAFGPVIGNGLFVSEGTSTGDSAKPWRPRSSHGRSRVTPMPW